MFLNREDGSVAFNRTWEEYKSGFGDVNGEFWLGLETLHNLTSDGQYGMRVDFGDFEGNQYWAGYSSFSVGAEGDKYRLSISGFNSSSTGGDTLTYHNSMNFTTLDQDNDMWYSNCARELGGGGGFWYRGCSLANPTGSYYTGGREVLEGVIWYYAKNNLYSFKYMRFTLIPK